MFGSSRASLGALRESMDARRGQDGVGVDVASELFSVASLLDSQKSLLSTLADTGTPAGARAGIVTDLLGSSLSPLGLDLVRQAVAARWSTDADLIDALEIIGAQAALLGAGADGSLDRVEDELFRFGRAVDASPDLQLTLTAPALSAERKAAVVADLLTSAAPVTTVLLTHTAGHLRGRAPSAAIAALSSLAAAQREQVLATVRSAIPLTTDQRSRLTDTLARLSGRAVRLNVEIDPSVVGGIVVRLGDEVIDGSIATRLDQAHRAMSA